MLLKADKISKRYFRKKEGANNFYAVSETSFETSEGKVIVILGRSGSGKTTFLNMLSGLLSPTEGKVYLDNTDLYSLSDKELSRFRNEKISVIPQGRAVLDTLTVMENILLPATLYKNGTGQSMSFEELKNQAAELMKLLSIEHLADVKPAELSGGELRRVSITRALLNNPQLILADEPTGDLDDENTKIVLELLQKRAREGAIVILVTHEDEARKYADAAYRMNAGVLEVLDTASESPV